MKTKFTVSEIANAKIKGKTSQTVRRELKSRNASTTTVGKTIYVDASELTRIYTTRELDFNLLRGDGNNDDAPDKTSESKPKNNNNTEAVANTSIQLLEEKIKSKDKEIEWLGKQLERETEIANDMKDALERSQEVQNKTTLMLEHYKNDEKSDSEKLKSLEIRVANQEKKAAEEKENTDKAMAINQDLQKAMTVYKYAAVILILMAIIAATLFIQNLDHSFWSRG